MADLVSLPPEELLTELRNLGLTGPTGEPLLEMRRLRNRLRDLALDVGNGTSRIDAEALRSEMGRALHDAISQGIKEVVGEAGIAAHLDAGAEPGWQWVWLAVADEDTCAPCEDRHGQEQALDEWESDGMPRAPRGVCLGGGRCRCELVPIRPADAGESAAGELREAAE
ncbi:MAG: hypothetical protein IT374_26350 [Polyangiaceae bacterium]|nr:hypothetical protein [Polyangiaceae bacterium]